jgi:hypothetical protein
MSLFAVPPHPTAPLASILIVFLPDYSFFFFIFQAPIGNASHERTAETALRKKRVADAQPTRVDRLNLVKNLLCGRGEKVEKRVLKS